MISDTLRQKFLYSTPFSDDDYPLAVLDDGRKKETPMLSISGTSLYFWEKDDFDRFVSAAKGQVGKVIILNDYAFQNHNQRLENGLKCYLMSFAYHFQKAGFRCVIQ